MLGWSAGARAALVLTSIYPQMVENLILLGISSFQRETDTNNIINYTKDVNKWNQRTIDNYLRAYNDINEVQQLWDNHMAFIRQFTNYFPNGIIDNKFETIKCPLLVIHGDQVSTTTHFK